MLRSLHLPALSLTSAPGNTLDSHRITLPNLDLLDLLYSDDEAVADFLPTSGKSGIFI